MIFKEFSDEATTLLNSETGATVIHPVHRDPGQYSSSEAMLMAIQEDIRGHNAEEGEEELGEFEIVENSATANIVEQLDQSSSQ